MDCVKRKNQNQKFRQISHFPFHGSRLDNSTPTWTDGTQKNIPRRHAAMIGLMPIEPFFTIQDSSSPPADDADRERSDEYADRERSDDPRSSISRLPIARCADRRRAMASRKKKEVSREGGPSIIGALEHARRVSRVQTHASVDASRRAFVDRVQSRSGWMDGRTCMMLRVWCVADASWYEAPSLCTGGRVRVGHRVGFRTLACC